MMRESDQSQRMKQQNELKTPVSASTNVPLMSMAPMMPATNSSSAFLKDFTSNLFEQKPSQPMYTMTTSQTMPSLLRPTIANPTSVMHPRPSSNATDLTSSLLNNINSLGSRPQTTIPLNSMNTNMNFSPFNSGAMNGGMGLFQPPPPPSGSTLAKTSPTSNPKTAAAELDDLFN